MDWNKPYYDSNINKGLFSKRLRSKDPMESWGLLQTQWTLIPFGSSIYFNLAGALVKKGYEVELIIGFLPSKLLPPEVPALKINILDKSSVTKMFVPVLRLFKKKIKLR